MQFVVCVDGSEGSDRALAHAEKLVEATGGSLLLVHVVEPDVYERRGDQPIATRSEAEQSLVIEAIEDAEARGEDVLADAREAVASTIEVEDVLLYGDADDAIAEYVEGRPGIDGVVVGHRDVSDRHRDVLGSVARRLIELSPVPVTVVRET